MIFFLRLPTWEKRFASLSYLIQLLRVEVLRNFCSPSLPTELEREKILLCRLPRIRRY